jgi:hypothetical protein
MDPQRTDSTGGELPAQYRDVVIPISESESAVYDLHNFTPVSLFVPSGFDGTSVTFLWSPDNGTFFEQVDGAGAVYSLNVAAGEVVSIPAVDFLGARYLKIVSNATETAERTLILGIRSFK